nr:MAG TPA: hypothetical protein [Caudoviricetes sp.]
MLFLKHYLINVYLPRFIISWKRRDAQVKRPAGMLRQFCILLEIPRGNR